MNLNSFTIPLVANRFLKDGKTFHLPFIIQSLYGAHCTCYTFAGFNEVRNVQKDLVIFWDMTLMFHLHYIETLELLKNKRMHDFHPLDRNLMFFTMDL